MLLTALYLPGLGKEIEEARAMSYGKTNVYEVVRKQRSRNVTLREGHRSLDRPLSNLLGRLTWAFQEANKEKSIKDII